MTLLQQDSNPIDLFSRRLLILAGKGGVGRTTAACALAVLAAQKGKRVLLAQTNATNQLQPLLGLKDPVSKIQQVRENLWAVCMTPETALEEYGTMIFHSNFLYRQIFDRDIVRTLLRAVPGLFDYSMLGKVWYHTTEQSRGRPRFDLVIFDGPATGHLLSLLQIPKSILRLVQNGPLAAPAGACQELLTDSKRCLALIVTLAEELPVAESIELGNKLRQLGIGLGAILFNRLYPVRFLDPKNAHLIADLSTHRLPGILQNLIEAAALQNQRALLDREYVAQMRTRIFAPQIYLPYLFRLGFYSSSIEFLATQLQEQVK